MRETGYNPPVHEAGMENANKNTQAIRTLNKLVDQDYGLQGIFLDQENFNREVFPERMQELSSFMQQEGLETISFSGKRMHPSEQDDVKKKLTEFCREQSPAKRKEIFTEIAQLLK